MKGHGARTRRLDTRVCTVLLILALGGGAFLGVPGAAAEEYDPQEAGHPLKLVAYLAFPIGTLVDYGLMRPAYWLVTKQPFRTLFGFDYMAQEDERIGRSGAEGPQN